MEQSTNSEKMAQGEARRGPCENCNEVMTVLVTLQPLEDEDALRLSKWEVRTDGVYKFCPGCELLSQTSDGE